MPYCNVLVKAISLFFITFVYRLIDACRSVRLTRIRYLQLKTHGKFEDSLALNELYHLVNKDENAQAENIKNSSGIGNKLKNTKQRQID